MHQTQIPSKWKHKLSISGISFLTFNDVILKWMDDVKECCYSGLNQNTSEGKPIKAAGNRKQFWMCSNFSKKVILTKVCVTKSKKKWSDIYQPAVYLQIKVWSRSNEVDKNKYKSSINFIYRVQCHLLRGWSIQQPFYTTKSNITVLCNLLMLNVIHHTPTIQTKMLYIVKIKNALCINSEISD